MSVLYIGSIYPTGCIEKLSEAGSEIDFAAETFQLSLLEGLCEYYPELKIVTAPNISHYPKIKIKHFEPQEFDLSFSRLKHYFTGFSNISYKKAFSKFWRIRKYVQENIDKDRENIIIIYGVHTPFLISLFGLKKSKYKSCLIVPDLPEFMSENKNIIYRAAKKIDRIIINFSLRYIDSFVLFSPHMKKYLPIKEKKWIHIEGIFNTKTVIEDNITKEEHKTILYTGNLSERMGIKDLLSAFSMIKDKNYRLWIRGNGICKDDVINASNTDSRIKYIPPLSKRDLLILQKKATVLINPVFPSKTFTKYFFPSKTMEYMASGTPTLMYRLGCLPKDYYPYLYFMEDESVDGIKNKLIDICEKSDDELKSFGQKASNFIINEKNEKKQAGKISKFITDL